LFSDPDIARFNQADTEETLKRLADDILPEFSGPDFTG